MTNPPTSNEVEEMSGRFGQLIRLASPLPWEWYNGCSWWRLGTVESSGCKTVICPTNDRSDGHPNLIVSQEDRALIVAAMNELPAILSALQSLSRQLEEARNKALEEAAAVVDQCNREGPYNAIGAAVAIRALKSGAPDAS